MCFLPLQGCNLTDMISDKLQVYTTVLR